MTRVLVVNLKTPMAEATTTVSTDCVLDVTGLGEVIGVEILDLAFNTGQRPAGTHGLATLGSGERVRWSYDQVADAFNIAIKEDRSLDQRIARCSVGGTKDGRLVSVTVEVDRTVTRMPKC